MIVAARSHIGHPEAICTCTECGHSETVPAPHERSRGNREVVKEGAVMRKLQNLGWSVVRKKLRCPTCELARKTAEQERSKFTPPAKPAANNKERPEMTMTIPKSAAKVESREIPPPKLAAVAPPAPQAAEPNPKQTRAIMSILELAYDDAKQRYKPGESDQTVAEAVGDGVAVAWIAPLREKFFGPDPRGPEIEDLRNELASANERRRVLEAQVRDLGVLMDNLADQLKDLR